MEEHEGDASVTQAAAACFQALIAALGKEGVAEMMHRLQQTTRGAMAEPETAAAALLMLTNSVVADNTNNLRDALISAQRPSAYVAEDAAKVISIHTQPFDSCDAL